MDLTSGDLFNIRLALNTLIEKDECAAFEYRVRQRFNLYDETQKGIADSKRTLEKIKAMSKAVANEEMKRLFSR